MRSYVFSALVLAAAVTVPAAQARERSESKAVTGAADIFVRVLATTAAAIHGNDYEAATVENGASRTVDKLTFTVGVNFFNKGPDQAGGTLVYGLDLPAGLHWAQPGRTDPECTFTATAATCQSKQALPAQETGLAFWPVTADAPGSYAIMVHASSSTPDPNLSDNSASATVIVQLRALAGAAKVVPKRPKAGSLVRVRVRGITVGGDPVAPTAARCFGKIGLKTVKGAARTGLGAVTCAYRTSRSVKGRALRGAVSFIVGQSRIRRRFAVTLR